MRDFPDFVEIYPYASIQFSQTFNSFQYLSNHKIRGWLHDAGMTFIPVWRSKSGMKSQVIPVWNSYRYHVNTPYQISVDENYACATRSSLPRDQFTPKRVAVPCLHDTSMSFRSGTKILSRYSNRDEFNPVWVVPVWDFGSVSCKQIQSHKREPGWTHTGMKVIPVSCKHPLIWGWLFFWEDFSSEASVNVTFSWMFLWFCFNLLL